MAVFCKDCKFAKIGWLDEITVGFEFAKCTNIEKEGFRNKYYQDVVTGKTKKLQYWYCSTARSLGNCGLDGKNFSPKADVLTRLVS